MTLLLPCTFPLPGLETIFSLGVSWHKRSLKLLDSISLSYFVSSFFCTQLLNFGRVTGLSSRSSLNFLLDDLINSHDFTLHSLSSKLSLAWTLHLEFIHISLKLFDIYTCLAHRYLKIIIPKSVPLTCILQTHIPNSRNNCKSNYLALSYSPYLE